MTDTDLSALRALAADHAPAAWPAVQMSTITALLDQLDQLERRTALLRDASEVIGRFVSDEGWAQSDMDTMDAIDAELAGGQG